MVFEGYRGRFLLSREGVSMSVRASAPLVAAGVLRPGG